MQIIVKSIADTLMVELEKDEHLISDLKRKIVDILRYRIEGDCLAIRKGKLDEYIVLQEIDKVMDIHRTLDDYNIRNKSTVYLLAPVACPVGSLPEYYRKHSTSLCKEIEKSSKNRPYTLT
tara:strand:- start:1043 stop:1405 length:363 start_codon:yes stop_codon:yes gene_type:complete